MVFGLLRKFVRPKKKPTATPTRYRYRPSLDGLEDRLAPATFAVAPTGQDAAGFGTATAPFRTIQFALNQAASGDTILVATGTYTYNPATDITSPQPPQGIGATAAVVVFNKQINLFGGFSTSDFNNSRPDVNPTIIDGGGQVRGILVTSTGAPTSINLNGFTVQNSVGRPSNNLAISDPNERTSAFGGGMFVDAASATIRNVVFQNNQSVGNATNTADGGRGSGGGLAIRNAPSGAVNTIENVSFVSNQARGGNGQTRGGFALGGGMFVFNATVNGSGLTFRDNVAQAGVGGGTGQTSTLFHDALGGGLAVSTGGNVTLTGATATSNRAVGGAAPNGNAGAGFGGAFSVEQGNLVVRDSNIRGNVAQGGDGQSAQANQGIGAGLAEGGGIHSFNSNLTIERSFIIGNTAQGGQGTTFMPSAGGGGVGIVRSDGGNTSFNIINTIVAANQARLGNGASNVLGGGGGGFFLQGVTGNLTHVTVADNSVNNASMQGQGILLLAGSGGANVNLNFSIVAGHSSSNIPAIQVQQGNTITVNRAMFSGNTDDTNNGDGNPQPAGTFNGLNTVITNAAAGFVSPGAPNLNYKLAGNSPAVDQGNGSNITVDIDNKARVGAPDLGADELDSTQGGGGNQQTTNSNSLFIAGLYHDLLGRASDTGGMTFHQGPLDTGLNSARNTVGIEVAASSESRRNFIKGYYQTFLQRTGSDGEFAFWVSALQQGASEEQVIANVVGAQEYFSKAGGTNQAFLSKAYQDLLGRDPDAGSNAFLTALQNGSKSRGQVAFDILSSDEGRNRFITQSYVTYLNRQPTTADLTFWRGVVSQPHAGAGKPSPQELMIGGLIGSPEYFANRGNNTVTGWVDAVYRNYLSREPDEGGRNFFINRTLDLFANVRANTALVFNSSDEYRANRISSFYTAYLGRAASTSDIAFWIAQYKGGATDEQVQGQIAATDEAFAKAGGTNAAWLNAFYKQVLQRDRGQNETFYLNLLNNGQANRLTVAFSILTTQEYRNVVVRSIYSSYLGRTSSSSEEAFWSSFLGSNRQETVLAVILGSTEYYNRTHQFP